MKLTIELVPQTCWYSNVRSSVSKEEWDIIRKKCYRLARYICEICGETGQFQGYKYKLECHEIWQYDESTYIQRLIGFVGLCPLCHQIKHAGLTITRKGGLEVILNRLMKVNSWNYHQAADHMAQEFEIWENRSQHSWVLDISYLDHYKAQNALSAHKSTDPLPLTIGK